MSDPSGSATPGDPSGRLTVADEPESLPDDIGVPDDSIDLLARQPVEPSPAEAELPPIEQPPAEPSVEPSPSIERSPSMVQPIPAVGPQPATGLAPIEESATVEPEAVAAAIPLPEAWPPAPNGSMPPDVWPPVPPAGALLPRATRRENRHWLATVGVAASIAAVVVGGISLDSVVAAPSAGTQTVAGSVTITAAPGWVLASSASSNDLVLQKGDATLSVQVPSTDFTGSSTDVMSGVRQDLAGQVAQISYGDEHTVRVGDNDTTYQGFEAVISRGSGGQGGIVDGELVCMVVSTYAVVIEVGAPQGHLGYVTDDVASMLKTVKAKP